MSELLIKFASNVVKDPKSEKYRTVRLENKIFQSRLLPVAGAVESLFTMGFEEVRIMILNPSSFPDYFNTTSLPSLLIRNPHYHHETMLDDMG